MYHIYINTNKAIQTVNKTLNSVSFVYDARRIRVRFGYAEKLMRIKDFIPVSRLRHRELNADT